MNILTDFFGEPMYDLYMNMPLVGWDGKHESQICALMSGIQERHWLLDGSSECSQMIHRNYVSKLAVIRSALQLYIFLTAFHDLLYIARRKMFHFFFIHIENDTVRK